MKQLIAGFLMFGLIFGTAAFGKAAELNTRSVKFHGYAPGYSSSYDSFYSWEASQRDRIDDLYRDRMITQFDFDKLNNQLAGIETYHNQLYSNGKISHRSQKKLEKMEARLSADIDGMTNQYIR